VRHDCFGLRPILIGASSNQIANSLGTAEQPDGSVRCSLARDFAFTGKKFWRPALVGHNELDRPSGCAHLVSKPVTPSTLRQFLRMGIY
jgi:hypothetical protein